MTNTEAIAKGLPGLGLEGVLTVVADPLGTDRDAKGFTQAYRKAART